MCFVNDYSDYDWIARVSEESEVTSDKPVKCDECLREIPAGQKHHHVYQREHEECHTCEMDECLCKVTGMHEDGYQIKACCQCEKPDYGESCEVSTCQDCRDFLEGVQEAEEEAGCDGSEARPPLFEMMNAIQDGGPHEARRYFKKAIKLHPRLKTEGYARWLWQRMFA